MNELSVFHYEAADVRVITDEQGRPWWVAKDVCEVLEIGNSRMDLDRLPAAMKGVSTIDTPGGPQQVGVLSGSESRPRYQRCQGWEQASQRLWCFGAIRGG